MNYEDMSDFEVNKKVAGVFLPCDYLFDEKNKRVELANYQDVMIGDLHDQVLTPYQEFNPCNNPSDAWLIIVENKIAILPNAQGTWLSYGWKKWDGKQDFSPRKEAIDKNPLRAAMICFLKMKDEEK